VNNKRVRLLKVRPLKPGPVVYWMSRDQRAADNWALLHAQQKALELRKSLITVFCLSPSFLNATARQYDFMFAGLREVEARLSEKNITFIILAGDPARTLPTFIRKHKVSALITDFDPLRIKREWKDLVAASADVSIEEVDAHNIAPCRLVSDKQEYGARTIRPKLRRALPEFLEDFPKLKKHPSTFLRPWKHIINDWKAIRNSLRVDESVRLPQTVKPGEKQGRLALDEFISIGLRRYTSDRNDPAAHAQSCLSPYLHFGQLSAQRIALDISSSKEDIGDRSAFLEELIVRRELSDNFCLYNSNYDSFEGFPEWAKKTLNARRKDKRIYLYSLEELESASTHDDLWNAAQTEMVKTGRMHGYLRMYWAKKILEWSRTPEQALETAIYLNDKYQLDGRDPNGYAGIAWSIGGVHDRAWSERPVFGKIRYMSYAGCKSKFNIRKYIQFVAELGT
jgi:deoxyribodipyrimidine photo-lyase